ncbi:hypothetical protein IWW55_000445, partial [Coemansia sp. RSA 2706]
MLVQSTRVEDIVEGISGSESEVIITALLFIVRQITSINEEIESANDLTDTIEGHQGLAGGQGNAGQLHTLQGIVGSMGDNSAHRLEFMNNAVAKLEELKSGNITSYKIRIAGGAVQVVSKQHSSFGSDGELLLYNYGVQTPTWMWRACWVTT